MKVRECPEGMPDGLRICATVVRYGGLLELLIFMFVVCIYMFFHVTCLACCSFLVCSSFIMGWFSVQSFQWVYLPWLTWSAAFVLGHDLLSWASISSLLSSVLCVLSFRLCCVLFVCVLTQPWILGTAQEIHRCSAGDSAWLHACTLHYYKVPRRGLAEITTMPMKALQGPTGPYTNALRALWRLQGPFDAIESSIPPSCGEYVSSSDDLHMASYMALRAF